MNFFNRINKSIKIKSHSFNFLLSIKRQYLCCRLLKVLNILLEDTFDFYINKLCILYSILITMVTAIKGNLKNKNSFCGKIF